MQARSALFTVLGDVVRPVGDEVWLQALTAAMGALGISPEATRTALHRMTAEGWVEPRRVGRYAAYRLTAKGADRLDEAAERIYRLRAADWDGRWRLLVLPGEPGETPAELRRALAWMGFGRIDGTWASPHEHGGRLRALLADHGVTGALPFVAAADAATAEPQTVDAELASRAWNLSALKDAHQDFLATWRPAVGDGVTGAAAFAMRIRLVHHWRSFLFLDPGLPAALLPGDWRGVEAATRFRTLYEVLAQPSWKWWVAATDRHPIPTAARRSPAPTPFTPTYDLVSTA